MPTSVGKEMLQEVATAYFGDEYGSSTADSSENDGRIAEVRAINNTCKPVMDLLRIHQGISW